MKRSEMIRLIAEALADAEYGWRCQVLGEETAKKARMSPIYGNHLGQSALEAAEKNGMVLKDGSDENIDNVNFSWEDEA